MPTTKSPLYAQSLRALISDLEHCARTGNDTGPAWAAIDSTLQMPSANPIHDEPQKTQRTTTGATLSEKEISVVCALIDLAGAIQHALEEGWEIDEWAIAEDLGSSVEPRSWGITWEDYEHIEDALAVLHEMPCLNPADPSELISVKHKALSHLKRLNLTSPVGPRNFTVRASIPPDNPYDDKDAIEGQSVEEMWPKGFNRARLIEIFSGTRTHHYGFHFARIERPETGPSEIGDA